MRTLQKYRIAILLLSILLAGSLALLAVQFVRRSWRRSDEVTVKNNSIGAVEKDWTFTGEGLLPGDSETKDYSITFCLEKDAPVTFRAVVDRDESRLAEVLQLRVEDTASGAIVCQGKLCDLAGRDWSDTVSYDGAARKTVTYRITVTMDPAAGNAYRGAELSMRFRWSLWKEDAQ